MKFSKAILACYIMKSSPTCGIDLSANTIQNKVGDGGATSIQFSESSSNSDGTNCDPCKICGGDVLRAVFNPSSEAACVDCSSGGNPCDSFTIITSFGKDWALKFFTLATANMGSEFDPTKITLDGSNDYDSETNQGSWTTIFESVKGDPMSTERSTRNEYTCNNKDTYSHYSITFEKKANADKIYLGHYGLVQSYLNEHASSIHASITGIDVHGFVTPAPTDQPSESPSEGPSFSPSLYPSSNPSGTPYSFPDDYTLSQAVTLWTSNQESAISTYGPINTWDTAKVTSFHSLFKGKSTFNGDISSWNTSRVTTFKLMFHENFQFDQPLGNWNVSSATDMSEMFMSARKFNSPINDWNISKVQNFSEMFYQAWSFNQDLDSWDLASATNAYAMFNDCRALKHKFCWTLGNFFKNNMFDNAGCGGTYAACIDC